MNKNNRPKPTLPKRSLFFSIGIIALLTGIFYTFNFSSTKEKEELNFQSYFKKNYKIFSLTLPKDITFANEKVPLSKYDIREKLDRELTVNTYWQSQTLLFIKRANRWFPVIEPILKEHEIPEDFKYLALIESGFTNVVSPAGATGFWQLMETTARDYGLEVNRQIDERYHVEKSTEVACEFLKKAHDKFGSWTLAAASYNMGRAGLIRQLDRQKVNNYYNLLLNEETARYVFRILAAKEILSDPEKYGFHLRQQDLYPPIETYTVEVDTTVNDLAAFAALHDINYKTLKIFNPWMRYGYLPNKSRKKYRIKLPEDEYKAHFLVEEEEEVMLEAEQDADAAPQNNTLPDND